MCLLVSRSQPCVGYVVDKRAHVSVNARVCVVIHWCICMIMPTTSDKNLLTESVCYSFVILPFFIFTKKCVFRKLFHL